MNPLSLSTSPSRRSSVRASSSIETEAVIEASCRAARRENLDPEPEDGVERLRRRSICQRESQPG